MDTGIKRIGLFGGTFNPIHVGHLIVAEDVRYKMGLDRILFIPSNQPPHKSVKDLASPSDRLNMVRLAIEGNSYFDCLDIEIKRGGKSYTIDTLREIKSILDGNYFFIIGSEAFLSFHTWKDPVEVLKEVDFVVMSRPQGAVSSQDLEGYLIDLEEVFSDYSYLNSEVVGEKADVVRFTVRVGGVERSVYYVRVVGVEISSTMVRKRIKRGVPFRYLVPDKVYSYIVDRRLYFDGT